MAVCVNTSKNQCSCCVCEMSVVPQACSTNSNKGGGYFAGVCTCCVIIYDSFMSDVCLRCVIVLVHALKYV